MAPPSPALRLHDHDLVHLWRSPPPATLVPGRSTGFLALMGLRVCFAEASLLLGHFPTQRLVLFLQLLILRPQSLDYSSGLFGEYILVGELLPEECVDSPEL